MQDREVHSWTVIEITVSACDLPLSFYTFTDKMCPICISICADSTVNLSCHVTGMSIGVFGKYKDFQIE